MNDLKKPISEFFTRYEGVFNKALAGGEMVVEGVVSGYAENFIAADPSGVTAGKNDYSFRSAIPKGWMFYKSIGVQSMNIISSDITILDDFHAMAKILWQCLYKTKDGKEGRMEFVVIYFLQVRSSGAKIFAYITGDEQRALKEAGLVNR